MPKTRLIDQRLLTQTALLAKEGPRLRKNANFHPTDNFPAHRLINAMQPGSYVRPHRHLDATKDETIIALQGRFAYLSFDEAGNIVEAVELIPGGPVMGIDIPHGTVHTILALEPDSVFFEAKAGPFVPLSTDETAAWSPLEGSLEAQQLWKTWRARFA
ncbi:MAG: WbuC family cupin fold metalloprotein [Fluviibacter sp.]